MARDNFAVKLWNTIQSWVTQNAAQYVMEAIPADRTDNPPALATLDVYSSYFRIWLSDMFLKKSKEWFQGQVPAVHATVQLKFGNQNEVTFSRVAGPDEKCVAAGVRLNY